MDSVGKLASGQLLFIALVVWPIHSSMASMDEMKNIHSATSREAEGSSSAHTFSPNSNLVFSVPRTSTPLKIDGKLDEPQWKNSIKLDNFTEIDPGDNVKPKVKTEAFFLYDKENLYIGFACYEEFLQKIRVSICDRDEIFLDDVIGVMLDTFNDKQNGYEFFVNPYGIQADLKRTENNEDPSFDTVWESRGEVNSIGWTAEVAIPFRSLRFPDTHEQVWRIHIIRVRPRDSREQISWAPISRDETCLFCQAGTLRGIEGVNQGKNLEILPYVIASESGSLTEESDTHSGFNNDNPKGEGGIGLKYNLTPNLTWDLTLNPDFSQVESDVAQVDVNTTFALFYPEKRPFFLEGNDIFKTEANVVYTRSINDPMIAAKLTGKVGRYTIGYVLAQDETSPYIVPFEERSELALGEKSFSNVLRFKRDLLSDSYVGMVFTDRHFATSYNSAIGVDGSVRFKENYRITWMAVSSYTKEPDDSVLSADFADTTFGTNNYSSIFDGESFVGSNYLFDFEREARHLNFSIFYRDASPTFRAENGFVTSNNFRMGGLETELVFQPNNRIVELILPSFNWGRKYNYDGIFKDTWISPHLFIRFKKQTMLWLGYLWSKERFKGQLLDGIQRFEGNLNTNVSEMISGGIYWRVGRSIARSEDPPILGHERTFTLWSTLKPTKQLKLDISYDYSKMLENPSGPELFRGYILRSKLTYQFTRRLFLRLITQYDDFDSQMEIDPLLSYKINPFTVFFLGSTHNLVDFEKGGLHQTKRQFFLKFQYLFRI